MTRPAFLGGGGWSPYRNVGNSHLGTPCYWTEFVTIWGSTYTHQMVIWKWWKGMQQKVIIMDRVASANRVHIANSPLSTKNKKCMRYAQLLVCGNSNIWKSVHKMCTIAPRLQGLMVKPRLGLDQCYLVQPRPRPLAMMLQDGFRDFYSIFVVGHLESYRAHVLSYSTYVLLYSTMVLLVRPTKVRR